MSRKIAYIIAFEGKELALFVGACGVACERTIGSNYPMAGDDYGDGIVTYCIAYGLGGHGFETVFGGYELGKGAVGSCGAVGDIAEVPPDLPTERGALGGEGESGDWRVFAGEVEVEP